MEFPSKTLQPLKYQIPLEGGGHSNVPFNQRAGSIPPCSFLLVQIRAVMKQHQKAARLSDILLKRAEKGILKMHKSSVQPSGILPPADGSRTDSIATLRSARLLLCGDIHEDTCHPPPPETAFRCAGRRGTGGPPTRTETVSDDQNLEKPETGPDAFQKLRDSGGGWVGGWSVNNTQRRLFRHFCVCQRSVSDETVTVLFDL